MSPFSLGVIQYYLRKEGGEIGSRELSAHKEGTKHSQWKRCRGII